MDGIGGKSICKSAIAFYGSLFKQDLCRTFSHIHKRAFDLFFSGIGGKDIGIGPHLFHHDIYCGVFVGVIFRTGKDLYCRSFFPFFHQEDRVKLFQFPCDGQNHIQIVIAPLHGTFHGEVEDTIAPVDDCQIAHKAQFIFCGVSGPDIFIGKGLEKGEDGLIGSPHFHSVPQAGFYISNDPLGAIADGGPFIAYGVELGDECICTAHPGTVEGGIGLQGPDGMGTEKSGSGGFGTVIHTLQRGGSESVGVVGNKIADGSLMVAVFIEPVAHTHFDGVFFCGIQKDLDPFASTHIGLHEVDPAGSKFCKRGIGLFCIHKVFGGEESNGEKLFPIDPHKTVFAERDLVASASRFKLKIQGLSRERISSLEDKVYTITFKHGSRVVDTQKIKFGQSPTLPQMGDVGNEYFKAWCKDKTLQTEVSPDTLKTYRDTTYYAKYAPDLEKVEKQIKEEGLDSVVTIYTDQIGRINNVYTTTSTQGSGVIVKIEGSKAYVLTNAHVVYTKDLTLTSLKITDSFGRRYNAEVSKRLGVDAIREDYDLALLEFTIIDEKLRATEMSEINPVIDDLVVAVGSPEGIRNSVTYGKCVTYQLATGEISLDFQVLWHDADITHGSSGGALFNSSCQLVGINYAGTGKDNGSYGIAIPIDKVKEFINLYTSLTLE